jgi:hypothetical protein
MAFRRARGAILRLVRRRPVAVAVGSGLVACSFWLELSGRFSEWWVDGVSLVVGATGAAILWTGLNGGRPDWVDPSG